MAKSDSRRLNAVPGADQPMTARLPAMEEPRLYMVSPANLARVVLEVDPGKMLVDRAAFTRAAESFDDLMQGSLRNAAAAGVEQLPDLPQA